MQLRELQQQVSDVTLGVNQQRRDLIDGGFLKSKRHVNLPGVRVNLPAITEKDRHDIRFGIGYRYFVQ